MEKKELNSIVILPGEGVLMINGERKPYVSSFILEFSGGEWELTLTEHEFYRAQAPIGITSPDSIEKEGR